ncbi:MAG: hypothetical protein IT372_28175 [Polyangiaceae bacterium]|nr:hypothetical protein [Polyangiaceae bacterium]
MALQETQYDRPPEGLQRGRYPAPRWMVAAVGAAVVLGAIIYMIWRARRAARPPEQDAPRTSRRRP